MAGRAGALCACMSARVCTVRSVTTACTWMGVWIGAVQNGVAAEPGWDLGAPGGSASSSGERGRSQGKAESLRELNVTEMPGPGWGGGIFLQLQT